MRAAFDRAEQVFAPLPVVTAWPVLSRGVRVGIIYNNSRVMFWLERAVRARRSSSTAKLSSRPMARPCCARRSSTAMARTSRLRCASRVPTRNGLGVCDSARLKSGPRSGCTSMSFETWLPARVPQVGGLSCYRSDPGKGADLARFSAVRPLALSVPRNASDETPGAGMAASPWKSGSHC